MFKLEIYCRRTLNTIPPRWGFEAPSVIVAKPAASRPERPHAGAFSRPREGLR